MRFQNVYETKHLDFEATCDKVCSIIPGALRERAGRKIKLDVGALSFKLPSTNITVLIFPKGPDHKIQLAWRDAKEKEACLPELKNLLVPIEGHNEVVLTPLYTTIVARVKFPFPGPLNFTLAWCKDKILYVAPIQLAKALLVSFAFATLFMFEWFCLWPTFGMWGGGALAFILVGVVWDEFKKKFRSLAYLVNELAKYF